MMLIFLYTQSFNSKIDYEVIMKHIAARDEKWKKGNIVKEMPRVNFLFLIPGVPRALRALHLALRQYHHAHPIDADDLDSTRWMDDFR